MSAASLLDTNIIIYLLDATQPQKYRRAEELVASGLQGGRCYISTQVVQETLHVALKKLKFSQEDAGRLLHQTLLPICKTLPVSQLYQTGLDVHYRYQYSFYDALIIAAALNLGCNTLYSEDLQHGQAIGSLTIENPFRK